MSDYAGDLSPQDAWNLLESEPSAILVDVRTRAEWTYVGVADLSPLSKKPVLIEWQSFPEGQRNERFADEVAAIGADRNAPVLFLCRSGARSAAAASDQASPCGQLVAAGLASAAETAEIASRKAAA